MCRGMQYISNVFCFAVLSGLDPALLGLALTYAVTLSGVLQYTVRQSAEVENLVTDVVVSSLHVLLGMRQISFMMRVVMDTLVDGVS